MSIADGDLAWAMNARRIGDGCGHYQLRGNDKNLLERKMKFNRALDGLHRFADQMAHALIRQTRS